MVGVNDVGRGCAGFTQVFHTVNNAMRYLQCTQCLTLWTTLRHRHPEFDTSDDHYGYQGDEGQHFAGLVTSYGDDPRRLHVV